jgi:protein-S-isoprenylcysteine O-methyltransferase Ste14
MDGLIVFHQVCLCRRLFLGLHTRIKVFAQVFGLLNILLLMNIYRPSWVPPIIKSSLCTPPEETRLHLPLLVQSIATCLSVGGYAFRRWSYQAMGSNFTFKLALLKDHKLITDGPYQFVRHPSYSGLTAVFFGAGMGYISAYNFATSTSSDPAAVKPLEHGDSRMCVDTLVLKLSGWVLVVWLPWIAYVWYSLHTRTRVEDELMKKNFGKQWIVWSQRVRYRYIPGVV